MSSKVTALTNVTGATLVDADEFYVVDQNGAAGSPASRAITLAELKVAIGQQAMDRALVKPGADLTAQNFSAGAPVPFDSEVYDTASIHDTATNNTRLTVPAGASLVRILANVGLKLVFSNAVEVLSFLKNGVDLSPSVEERAEMNNGDPALGITSYLIPVIPGDYFELRLLCTDTSMTINAENTWFSMEVVE